MAVKSDTNPVWLADLLLDGEVYEVGGSVRDRLLGAGTPAVSKDRDYLVRLIPLPKLQQRLRRHGKVNLVGKSFGVVKFTPAHGDDEQPVTYDVALPRRERSSGVGHREFDVDFDPDLPLAADLGRRDFTINAIAQNCATGAIVDPLDGRADLRERVLRMVFAGSFTEDPLRILRGAQFAARFGCTIEPVTWEAMREAVSLVDSVSRERVAEELTKLLTLAAVPSVGIQILQTLGVLEHILPELAQTLGVDQPGGYHAYDVFEHSLRTADAAPARLRLRWAALLHDVNKPQCREIAEDKATFYGHDRLSAHTAKRILTRLRYPHELAQQVALLIDKHMFTTAVTDKGVRRLIRKLGPELIYDLLDLRRADVVAQGKGGRTDDVDEFEARITAEINSKPPFNRTDLAVDGSDLMSALGLDPGPDLGRLLDSLLEAVLDDPALNTRRRLLSLARKLLADKPNK